MASLHSATTLVSRVLRGSAAAPKILHAFTKAARTSSPRMLTASASPASSFHPSSNAERVTVYNRPSPNYPGHVPLTKLERLGLAVGSALGAFLNPRRADLIAACGEATATPYFIYRLRDAMLSSPTGRRILRDRPRITSTSLNIPHLCSLPPNTVGAVYAAWLDREHVSPDTRAPVRYIDDEECAYVMQRYRECHDFYHALMGMPTMREGEVALKAFEFMNTMLPMTGLSVFAAATLKPKEKERFRKLHLPWAIRAGLKSKELINVYWEEVLEMDVGELRRQLNIEVPPDLREIRARSRKKKKAREERERMLREGIAA